MHLIDQIPLWAFFIAAVSLALVCQEGGFQYGKRCPEATPRQASVGAMVNSMVGLLAFMLAFTFGIATSRFDDRRRLVLSESNAIGTTFLRADLLEEPFRTSVKDLLRQYVDVRAKGFQSGTMQRVISQSELLQDQLWDQTAKTGQKHPDSPVVALFIQSMNEMIDLHAKRVTASLRARVPESIWYALLFIAGLSVIEMGYQSGLSGARNWLPSILLITAFSTVLLLVVDLDRPGEGSIQVSQQSMIDLDRKLCLPSSRPR